MGGTEVTLFYDWKPSAWKEAVRLSSCKVVGLLCWEPGDNENETDYMEELFAIERKTGIGDHLIHHYNTHGNPRKLLELQVHRDNTQAREFYDKLGWELAAVGKKGKTEWIGQEGRFPPSTKGNILRITREKLAENLKGRREQYGKALPEGLAIIQSKRG